MHQSLCIDEVLRIIFAHAAGDKQDLTCLARVCKGWKDPALDLIWERLSSLQPLLALIPNLTKAGKTYIRTSALLEEEIQTLRFYGSKVRTLAHSEFAVFDADKFAIFFSNSACNPSQLLLPFLRHSKLSCKLWTQHCSGFLLSTNLRCLDIDFNRKHLGQHTTNFYSVIKQALLMAEDLRELHIRGVLSQEFEEIVPHMQKIRKLSLRVGGSLTPRSFSIVARLPNISELTIHLDKFNKEDLDLDTPLFSSIYSLQLRGNSDIFQPLLSRLPTDQLSYLWLEAMDHTHDDVKWDDVIASISTLCSTSLEELVLEHHVELSQDEPQTLDTTADTVDQSSSIVPTATPPCLSFKSFCKMRALQRLQLEMTVPPTYDESEIADLVEGCPQLKHLNLGGTSGFEYYGVMFSLKENALRTFAKFQNLESLVLPSAYTMDTSILLPQPDTRNLSVLRSLTLGKTSAVDANNFAKHLFGIFPHLKGISGASAQNVLWDSTNIELFRLTSTGDIVVTSL